MLQGRAPQIVLGISKKTMPGFKSVADLKGKKIGVTAPGSSTNVMANFVLAKAGLKPADVSFIGVGATSAAIAAIRQGQIDALSHLDPVVTILERSGDIKVVTDTRIVAEADKVFGGPMPAACLYAPQAFIDKNPATVQALANAIVRADRWIQAAGPTEIIRVVPEDVLRATGSSWRREPVHVAAHQAQPAQPALLAGRPPRRGVRVLARDDRAGIIRPFVFDNEQQAAFFFGEPLKILGRIWNWFFVATDIYKHLWITLLETVLAFGIGTVFGLVMGLWLALSPMAAAILDPYIKALNSMPRVILAPIFAVWFGLGVASKVALGVTLVFFIVFFNVYQGVKEVSPVVLANARMLGANRKQLLRHVYLPSATSWVFSSLHTSVGLAFVGAVVGEYLGSSSGVGYLILQAEGSFDINTVMAGILVLTAFALVLDAIVGRVERRLMKWQPMAGETEKI